MYVIIESKTGNHILIKSQDKLVITKGYGVPVSYTHLTLPTNREV